MKEVTIAVVVHLCLPLFRFDGLITVFAVLKTN